MPALDQRSLIELVEIRWVGLGEPERPQETTVPTPATSRPNSASKRLSAGANSGALAAAVSGYRSAGTSSRRTSGSYSPDSPEARCCSSITNPTVRSSTACSAEIAASS